MSKSNLDLCCEENVQLKNILAILVAQGLVSAADIRHIKTQVGYIDYDDDSMRTGYAAADVVVIEDNTPPPPLVLPTQNSMWPYHDVPDSSDVPDAQPLVDASSDL